MNPEKRDFNLAAKSFLYLSLVANLILVISCFVKIRLNSSLEISTIQPVVNMLFTIAILITGMFIFRVSKIALTLFISLFIARLFVVSSLGGGYGFAFNLGGNMWLIIRDLLPFMIALCFKKDGISGWKAFFMKISNTESVPETVDNSYSVFENSKKTDTSYPEKNDSVLNEQTSEATTIVEANKENIYMKIDILENQPLTNDSTEDKNESSPAISTINVKDSKENTTDTNIQKNKLNKRKLIPLLVPLILILGGVTLFTLITTSAPDGFNGFENKFKYYFGMHNNTLAKEYLTKALNANANDLQKLGKEFFDMAVLANPSDLEILDSLAKTCYMQAHNNKEYSYDQAVALCDIALSISPDHLYSMKVKGFAYYYLDSIDKAYSVAEQILLNTPNDLTGLILMSYISYDKQDWRNLLKWSKKGYDNYRSESDFCYLYAKSLYENSQEYLAKQFFEEAEDLDPNNWYRDKFIQIGGLPCSIQGVKIVNKRKDGTIVSNSNEMLYTNRCYIIRPSITLKSIREGKFTLMARLYTTDWNGQEKLEGNKYFSVNFKRIGETVNLELNGWGDDTGIFWKEGGCYIEIWWESEKLYTKSFKIHDKFKVDLERSDREYKARMKEINKRLDELRYSY